MYKTQNEWRTYLFDVYFITLFLVEVSPENLSLAKTYD